VYKLVDGSAKHETSFLQEEQAYLDIVWDELCGQETEALAQTNAARDKWGELRDAVAWGVDEWRGDLKYARAEIERGKDRLNEIAAIKASAYFGRLDMAHRSGMPRQYRLGRWPVLKRGLKEPLVCDWRSPVAKFWYDPERRGNSAIRLRQAVEIKGDRVKAIKDRVINAGAGDGGDPYLASLQRVTAGRMKQIVRSIQSEQYRLITAPANRSLWIDGCAGSGKTLVAYHRAAYLCYHTSLRPEEILVLAPNRAYIDYTQELPSDLDVDGIIVLRWADLVRVAAGESGLDVSSSVLDDDGSADLVRLLRSRRMAAVMERFRDYLVAKALADLPSRIVPRREEAAFTPFDVDKERLSELLLSKYTQLPVNQRVDAVAEDLTNDYLAFLRAAGDLVRPDERDQRFCRTVVGQYLAPLRINDAFAAYKTFFRQIDAILAAGPGLIEDDEAAGARRRKTFVPCRDDAAPLIYLAWLLHGMRSYSGNPFQARLVIADEAQDFSPMECLVLDRIAARNKGSVILIGDTSQRLSERWDGAPEGYAKHFLGINYRARGEIVDLAARLSGRVMASVPRRGDDDMGPALIRLGRFPDLAAAAAAAGAILRALGPRAGTAAILACDPAEARAVHQALRGVVPGLALAVTDEDRYIENRPVVMPVETARGLEFDTVILPDLAGYAKDDPATRRKLYVAVSRAVNRIIAATTGPVPEGVDFDEFAAWEGAAGTPREPEAARFSR